MKKNIKKMIEVAEGLDWTVDNYRDNGFEFSKFSPQGQDHCVLIIGNTLEDIVGNLAINCDNFDVSHETYLWLDESGHGTNGAPYDMKDLYEDMEACLTMMEELHDALEDLIEEEE